METRPHKTPDMSSVETRFIVMPNQLNGAGTLFGGELMAWIDRVAAMAAQKHAQIPVVTASMDSLSFRRPINLGDQVVIKARVNFVGRTSMEVGVRVETENPFQREMVYFPELKHCASAYLTFVGVLKRPCEVPEIHPSSEVDRRRWDNAAARVRARKDLLKELKKEV